MAYNKNKQKYIIGIFQFIVLFFLLINSIAHKQPIADIGKIFLYQFCCLFIAGYAISRILHIKEDNTARLIASSYALGFTVSLIIYMIFMLLGCRDYMPYVSCLETCVSLFIIYKTNKKENSTNIIHGENNWFGDAFCLIVMFLLCCAGTIVVSFVNTLPNETGGTSYYVDWPFWVGNNISFTKAFPNENFRMIGTEFKYHFFSSMIYAQMALCTNVDIVAISYYYSYIFSAILLVFSAYYLISKITNKKSITALAMLIILFTDSREGKYATFCWHTLLCPFGFDYGYGFSMMAIACLYEIIKNDKWTGYFPASVLYLAMTTGSKGPNGLVILSGFGMAAFYMLVKRKIKSGIIAGLTWLGVFLLIYFVFINSPLATGESGLQIVGFNKVCQSTYDTLIANYRIVGNHPGLKIFSAIQYLIRINTVVTFLVFVSIVKLIINVLHKRNNPILMCLVMISVVGLGLTVTTEQIGGSQMYFGMSIFPFGTIAGLLAIEETQKKEIRNGLLLFTIAFFGFSSSIYHNNVLIYKTREGLNRIRNKYSISEQAGYFADADDYEAYLWLRNNTDINAIVATDSFVGRHGKDISMSAGVFSERYIWNEVKYAFYPEESARRNEIVNKLNSNPVEAIQELKTENVNYLLLTVKDNTLEYEALSETKKVFENNNFIIYEIIY